MVILPRPEISPTIAKSGVKRETRMRDTPIKVHYYYNFQNIWKKGERLSKIYLILNHIKMLTK